MSKLRFESKHFKVSLTTENCQINCIFLYQITISLAFLRYF